MTRVLVPLLLSALLLALPHAHAAYVEDLYAAEVPVASQSTAVLAAAARDALGQVVVKVSGSSAVLQNPAVIAALARARSQVQQYSYNRAPGPDAGLTARFEFDQAYITDLITRAGLPLWTSNRPLVLAWIVVETPQGREFLNADTMPELTAQVLAQFAHRGVPLQLPLYDLADTAAIAPEEAWQLQGSTLLAASARYKVQDILAGRLATLSTGSVVGDWAYLYGNDRLDRSGSAASTQMFFANGAALVAEEMSARYAVAPSAGSATGVVMSVVGVSTYADYAAIVSWLESLELIDVANVERVRGDRIELRLQAQADARQLAAIIELNKRLEPLPVAPIVQPGMDPGPQLSYQWQP